MSGRDPTLPEDLSARARRGPLSDAEEALLERELTHDPALRLAHQVGLDMDRSTAVRVGDEALIARAADRALERVRASGLAAAGNAAEQRLAPSQRPKRRRAVSLLLAAALVCVAGAAAGMWAGVVPARWFEPRGHETPKVATSGAAAKAPGETRAEGSAPAATAPDTAPPTNSTDVIAPGPADTNPVAPRTQRAARTTPEATAASLFKSANLARRDGDFAGARKLYSELIQRYPASDEAGLARVSLGKLLLENGEPAAAEREFGQYLKDGRGQLAEEALVSRAESFEKMGRTDAERASWQTLLARYPTSVYAAEAKGRLDALAK
jgi:TolA-binding protein